MSVMQVPISLVCGRAYATHFGGGTDMEGSVLYSATSNYLPRKYFSSIGLAGLLRARTLIILPAQPFAFVAVPGFSISFEKPISPFFPQDL
jgi:hypothetical protein